MKKSQEIVPDTDLTRKDTKRFIGIVVVIVGLVAVFNLLKTPVNYQSHMGQRIYCKHIPNAFLIGESEKIVRLKAGTGFATSTKTDCSFDSTGTVQWIHPMFEEQIALFRAESE